jgi:hypothetical protein
MATGQKQPRACSLASLCRGQSSWAILKPVKPRLPDFSDFIEVKRRGQEHHRMYVKRWHWHADRAYLLVCGAQHPRYRIVGWCWGKELATPNRWEKVREDREPCWYVGEHDPIMKSPNILRDMALEGIAT